MNWVLEYELQHDLAVPSWASVSIVVRVSNGVWNWIVSNYADGEYLDGEEGLGFGTPEEAMSDAASWFAAHREELEDRWD